MKIAYFLGALNRGGAETLIHDICRQHDKVPYDFVCVYRHEGNMLDAFKETEAALIRIPKKRGYFSYIWDTRRTLIREHVTIVHSQTPSNTLLLAVALVGTGIKIITTFHGHLFADTAWWKKWIVYAASEKIICVSEYQKQYYEEKWKLSEGNKLEVVYNGIDFSKLDSVVESGKCNVESRGIKLAMVGNFIKGRSQMVVVQALAEVESGKWKEKSDFYFIGRRDDREPERYDECVKYCEEKGLKNVHFLGSRNDVPAILKTIDGFIYSTEHDTFGIAVIEAIASGLPVVVNDWPVMKEVCGEANDGIRYFKTNDIEDAAAKITELIKNLNQCKQVAKVNAEIVRSRFSIQHHIAQLNNIYKTL